MTPIGVKEPKMSTLTFDEIHARVSDFHAAEAAPLPIEPRAALTPLGHAEVAGLRFVRALAALEARERTIVLATAVLAVNGPAPDVTYSLNTCHPPVMDPEIA